MITYRKGADLYIDYNWVDSNDEPIIASSVELQIDDVVTAAWLDLSDGITIHIPDDANISVGKHTYQLRANDGTDWTILDAGKLRVTKTTYTGA